MWRGDGLAAFINGVAVLWYSASAASDPTVTLHMLVVRLVLSQLDFGSAVLVGIPVYLVRRLQSVLNASARLIYRLKRCDHITDALVSLHWLRVPEHIQYKVAVLTRLYTILHRESAIPWTTRSSG